MLLPHIGTWPLGTYWLRKAMICCSACASVTPDALTLSINPLRPWVPLFQASILSSHSCDWWMTSTGPAMRGSRFGPVTTTAISSKRSASGVRPVISQSSQTTFWSDFASVHGLGGVVSGMARIVADGLAWFDALAGGRALALVGADLPLVSRHRSSVGPRWPSKRIAALHRLPIQLGMGGAMRLALRSDGCAQPTTSDP